VKTLLKAVGHFYVSLNFERKKFKKVAGVALLINILSSINSTHPEKLL
jgi:hypothetical protein